MKAIANKTTRRRPPTKGKAAARSPHAEPFASLVIELLTNVPDHSTSPPSRKAMAIYQCEYGTRSRVGIGIRPGFCS